MYHYYNAHTTHCTLCGVRCDQRTNNNVRYTHTYREYTRVGNDTHTQTWCVDRHTHTQTWCVNTPP